MTAGRKVLLAALAVLLVVVGVTAGVMLGQRDVLNQAGSPESQEPNVDSPYGQEYGEQFAPQTGEFGDVTVTETSVIVGDADAPRVVIYEDLLCPFCRALDLETEEQVSEWVDAGELSVEYIIVDYLGVRSTNHYSLRAANLLAYVADVSPEAWFDVKIALYEAQPAARGEEGPTDEDLIDIAREHGVEVDAEGEERIKGLAYRAWVDQATARAAATGVGGIPTVFINGEIVEEASEPGVFLDLVEQYIS